MQIPENLNITTGALIIGYDFTHGKDKGVLIVGQKGEGVDAKVINAFQGEDAEKIYKMLTTVKKKEEGETTDE